MAGTTAPFIGMGIVPITFPGSNQLYLLYPSYHMPDNPQDTLGVPALKFYNQCRSTRVEALAWFRIVSKGGDTITVPTIPIYHKKELQDYISINLHALSSTITIDQNTQLPYPKIAKTNIQPIPSFCSDEDMYAMDFRIKLHPPKVNLSFSKHDYIDWSILHRRFDHVKDEKLADMCSLQLLDGIPSKFPVKYRCHRRDCWICPRGSLHNDPHGITINTDHLRPGILIHMDFFFIDKLYTIITNNCVNLSVSV